MDKFIDIMIDCTKHGRKIKKGDYLEEGKFPVIDQGQKQCVGYSNEEEGLFNDVPVIIFGDHTRVIKYIDEPFFLGADGVKVLKSKDNNVDYRYLYYALRNVKIENTGYNRHYKWLKESKIRYPELNMQQEIATVLGKVERIIELKEKELNELDILIKSRFVEMFGDPVLNPMNWNVESLEGHSEIASGFPFDSNLYTETGIKICGGLIIMPDTIKWNECKYWKSTEGYEQYLLQDNDIVMAMDRTWITSGFKIAKIEQNDLPALLIQRTAVIRGTDINQDYLFWHIKNGSFDRHCNVTGSLVPHISLKDIRSYSIMMAPIKLQNEFATFAQQVDKLKVEVQKLLDETQILFDSLMQEYFE